MFSFCFLLAAFFSRARVGSTTAALLFLAIFFPYFAVQVAAVVYLLLDAREYARSAFVSVMSCFSLTPLTVCYLVRVSYSAKRHFSRKQE